MFNLNENEQQCSAATTNRSEVSFGHISKICNRLYDFSLPTYSDLEARIFFTLTI